MKHKVSLLAILLMVLAFTQSVKAYSFSAVAPSGQTLYYDISGSTVSVTYPGTNYYNPYDGYDWPTDSLVIPSSVVYNGRTYMVTSISAYAFYLCCDLTSVVIPSSITSIGTNAFFTVNNVIYHGSATGSPWGAKNINGYVSDGLIFSDSTMTSVTGFSTLTATSIVIPSTVTNIGEYAFFFYRNLVSVTIPNTVTKIDPCAFAYCYGLSSIILPNSINNIGSGAFSNCCNLTSVMIPNSVSIIGSGAFQYVNNIIYSGSATGSPWGAKNINGYVNNGFVFSDTTMTTITGYVGNETNIFIPEGTTYIGNYAFYLITRIASVFTGNSVITIGNNAFESCFGLTSVIVGNSVTNIGASAFYECTSLDTVNMLPEIAPTKSTSSFSNNASSRTFYIPCGSYNSYSNYYPRYEPEVDFNLTITPIPLVGGNVELEMQHGRTIQCDSTAVIRANAYNGYHFDHWSDDVTDNPYTLHLVGDSTVTAFFAPNRYTLTLQSNDTSIGIVSGGGEYNYGDTVTITATATVEHYHFVRWSDYNTYNTSNPRQYVITGNTTLTAYFAIDVHTVSVQTNDLARGMVEASGTEFAYGTPCTVTATAYTGYTFAGWSNGVTANPYTFAVLNDVELTALFIAEGEEVYTVTVESADLMMGTVSGGGQAMNGGEVSIHAIPNEGYRFLRWNDNDTNADRIVTVTNNATYTAYFESVTQGIADVDESKITVSVIYGRIYVRVAGEPAEEFRVYDVAGREVFHAIHTERTYPLSKGVYIVNVDAQPARKVVVIR